VAEKSEFELVSPLILGNYILDSLPPQVWMYNFLLGEYVYIGGLQGCRDSAMFLEVVESYGSPRRD
jgi:hypothetical protein